MTEEKDKESKIVSWIRKNQPLLMIILVITIVLMLVCTILQLFN